VSITARRTADTGYLLCDGAAVPRSTYATLFSVIGTDYGPGDGSTTFNVPDLVGRVPVGEDLAGARLTTFRFGTQSGGEDQHVLTVAEIPPHTHTYNLAAGAQAAPGSGAPSFAGGAGTWTTANQITGGGGAHNNMPPYLVLKYQIKV
jgi:microcystin-dependent protein